MSTLVSILNRHASQTPEALFIHHLDTEYKLSYGVAHQVASELTEELSKLRIGVRDKVAFVVRNHWLFFPLLVACSARRATLVPLDPELHPDELALILKDASPKLSIISDGVSLPSAYTSKARRVWSLTDTLDSLTAYTRPEERDLPTLTSTASVSSSADVTLMIYTSGTTGAHKCVMLTDANLIANGTSLARRYAITPDDRLFCILPTHHMNAIMMTGITPLVAGASVVLSDVLSFKNAKRFWRDLSEHLVTICSLVPSMMALLLKLSPNGTQNDLKRLRFGFCGAAPLPAHVWSEFERVFKLPIHQGYGLTETTCWAVSTLPESPQTYQSVGVPLDTEVLIDTSRGVDRAQYLVDFRGESSEEHQSGEVLIRGEVVSPGYYKNAKLTERSLTRDGFFRTGDLGYLDHKGCLHITGRIKEIIIRNGINLFSRDIDRVLCHHPLVIEAQTFGIPDELVGERVYTACVLHPGAELTVSALGAWIRARLSKHLWPDQITLMGYLPKSETGKVSVGTLRTLHTGSLAAELFAHLNTWKFKRAQPSRPQEIVAAIQRALMYAVPFDVVTYWGCGTRDMFAEVDRLALERLSLYVQGVERIPQSIPRSVKSRVTLILTDTHARNNRIPETRFIAYLSSVAAYAQTLGMEVIYLSQLWEEADLTLDQIHQDLSAPDAVQEWEAHPQREALIAQARKHVERGGEVEHTARTYLAMCMREGEIIARRYPHSVFATYNPPSFDCVSPPLPKVYLYSYKDRTSVKPWFVESGLP